MVEYIIERAKRIFNTEIWLSNETFNDVVDKSDRIQLNDKGYLEVSYKNVRIQISLYKKIFSSTRTCFAEIKEIAEYDTNTNLKKKIIFVCPKRKAGKVEF